MTHLAFKDHFSTYATEYAAFRPRYPSELFAFLAEAARRRDLVWDCATGSGQAAVPLAEHFTKVYATDASAEQIQNAERHPRVEYTVAPAEKCTLPDHSADLVTVAQALHWFHFDGFYAEVRRVTRSGGLIAVWTYAHHEVSPEHDRVIERLQNAFVRGYWPPGREHVDDHYRNIPFPFQEVAVPRFAMTANWDWPRLLGYLNTWSATRRFIAANGFNPLDRLAADFAQSWGDPATVRTVRWELALKLGRVL
jgi:hypothetical protein